MPKVSIIIPVYNMEDYLGQCLDSVVEQTLKDIEIICVNDGSKDKSPDIINDYASKDSRIIVVNKENGGLSSARNAGLDIASGKYIYFLDSDDYIDNNAMEILYNVAEKDKLDVLYFDGESFFENKRLIKKYVSYTEFYKRKHKYKEVMTGKRLFTKMQSKNEFRQSACLQFIRTGFIKDISLRFYEGILHEDNLFSFLCIMQAERVRHINEQFFKRRIREDSIMTKPKDFSNFYGYFICFIEAIKFLDGKDYDSSTLKEANRFINGLVKSAKHIFEKLPDEDKPDALNKNDAYINTMYIILIKDAESEKIKRSLSYKIGKAITFIPKKIRRFLINTKKTVVYLLSRRGKNKSKNI